MTSTRDEKVNIAVHPLTDDPTAVWDKMKKEKDGISRTVEPLPLDTPVSENAVRFVCISDTHSLTKQLVSKMPPGDVLIHAGDFTCTGYRDEVEGFNKFLGSLEYKHKILIAGNHELSFQPKNWFQKHISSLPVYGNNQETEQSGTKENSITGLLSNCTYLQDSATVVYGLRIYGSPWQPVYGGWAFNLPRGKRLLEKWNQIPAGVDVLVTHSPPLGHGDLCRTGRLRAGCVELLNTVQKRVKPKYHVFGHIHEGYGITTDGQTVFINASICTVNYSPLNLPIIFDIPLPDGYSKE